MLDGENVGESTLLIGDLLAVHRLIGIELDGIPVILEIAVLPNVVADGLGADLLGLGNAGALELAVGVVAAEADVDLIALRDDDVLHLAASVVADKVDVGILREQHIGHLEDRRDFLGCGNAELLLQFLNVLHGLGDVAPGVADGEKLVVNNRLLGGLAVRVQGKCDFAVQDNILLNIFCYSTFLMKGNAKIRRGKARGGGRDKR